eukprot:jgi/Botrbrau1/14051/Bobra.0011s0017.1
MAATRIPKMCELSMLANCGSIWTEADAKLSHEKFQSYRCATINLIACAHAFW